MLIDMSVQCNMAERRVSAGRNIPSLFLSYVLILRGLRRKSSGADPADSKSGTLGGIDDDRPVAALHWASPPALPGPPWHFRDLSLT